MGTRRAVADNEAGEIRGKETRSMQDRREREDDQRGGGDKGRVQALRKRDAVEGNDDRVTAENPDGGADQSLFGQHAGDRCPRLIADQQQFDQLDGEKHREWIVGGRLDFECGGDARPQPQTAGMD
jgi:hypothetical protein